MSDAQRGIFTTNVAAAHSLEFDLVRGDARVALDRLSAQLPPNAIVGLGQPLVHALGAEVPGLRSLETLSGRATLVAAQHGLWVLVTAETEGRAFEHAENVARVLMPELVLVEERAMFRYRDGRDLTGYEDGTANPKGDDAQLAALVQQGPLAGASFAFVQRFVHDRAAFQRLTEKQRDDVVGRAIRDNHELEDPPQSAHTKRTEQESFAKPNFLWRRSMPWGDLAHNGLQFIAFVRELDGIDAMLRRMVGLEDGIADALLEYTRAETGGYYFCPPAPRGQLDFSMLRR